MRIILIAVALGASFAPAPAFAADEATLACVDVEINPDIARSIAAEVLANAQSSRELVNPGGPSGDMLSAHISDCRKKHNWSKEATVAASAYGCSIFAIRGLGAALSQGGADPEAITGIFRSLPAKTRATFSDDSNSEEGGKAAIQALKSANVMPKSMDQAQQMLTLLSLLSLAESERAKFVSQ
jgi:hypothetical protein